jgi:hypothetical protein
MHIAAASALVMAVGFKDGFGSIIFMLTVCLTILISVDTLNVRNAASRQAEVVELIIERLRKREGRRLKRPKQGLSYRPVDMFTGAAVGIVFALLVF